MAVKHGKSVVFWNKLTRFINGVATYFIFLTSLFEFMIDSFSRQQIPPSQKNQHGLSLLELTIVLLIMMAMAGLILPSFNEVPAYAQCTATKSTMKAIRDALLGNVSGPGYVEDMGFYPVSLNALVQDSYCSDRAYTNSATCIAASETWQAEDTFSPVTAIGWRGSYMQESTALVAIDLADGNFENPTTLANSHISPYLAVGDLAILDSFSSGGARRPIIIQRPPTTPPTPPDKFLRLVSAGRDGILQTPISDPAPTLLVRGDDLILYLKTSDPISIAPADDQTGCVLTDE